MICSGNQTQSARRDLAVRAPETARERLRALLARNGVRGGPGEEPEGVLRRLRTALVVRRDDTQFWTLLARWVSDPSDFPVSEDPFVLDLLRGRILQGLLLDLRESLAAGGPTEPDAPWLSRDLSESGRFVFFLLAAAAGPSEGTAAGPLVHPWYRRFFAAACASRLEYESTALLALFCLGSTRGLPRAIDAQAPWTLPELSRAVAWLAEREGPAS